MSAPTRQKLTPKERLLQRAREILCERPNLSMSEIAEALSISRATLYRHYPSREELVRRLALDAIAATDAACDGVLDHAPSYREAFRRLIDAVIPLGATYHFLSRETGLFEDDAVMSEVRRQEQQTADLVDAAKAAGEIDPTLPTRWICRHFDMIVWLGWSEVAEGYVARRAVTDLAFRTFWRGVAP